MAILPILEYPDPRLRKRAEPVLRFDAELGRIVDDMFETMYGSRAIGLAAPQVDVLRRIVTIDVEPNGGDPHVFINPEISLHRQRAIVEESCMSVPGIVLHVERSLSLDVRAKDRDGSPIERRLEGLLAVCLQHEVDHLDGKVFVDRLSFFKRFRVRRQLDKRALAASP